MPRLGDQDLRDTPTLQRYISLVQETFRFGSDAKLSSRFPVVPCVGSEFRKYYDEWVEKGFEGCVAKMRDSKYRTSRMDGKTAEWMKVKTVATEDYVLISTTLTPGGKSNRPSVTGVWGLHVDGKLKPVLQCPCPKELLIPENFGKLVAEFKGALKFKSGALRHSGFVRVRTDKSPEDCVLR
jgi:ATP-dependent DNA ligase